MSLNISSGEVFHLQDIALVKRSKREDGHASSHSRSKHKDVHSKPTSSGDANHSKHTSSGDANPAKLKESADLVVKYLTPYFKDKKIASKVNTVKPV